MTSPHHSHTDSRSRARTGLGLGVLPRALGAAIFLSCLLALAVPNVHAGTQQTKPPPAQTITPAAESKLPAPPRKQDVKKGKEAYKQGQKLEQNGDRQGPYGLYACALGGGASRRA